MILMEKDIPNCIVANSLYNGGVDCNNELITFLHINHTFIFNSNSSRFVVDQTKQEANFFLSVDYGEDYFCWDNDCLVGRVADNLKYLFGACIRRRRFYNPKDYIDYISKNGSASGCVAEFDRFYIPDRIEFENKYGVKRTFTFSNYDEHAGYVVATDQESNGSKIPLMMFERGVDEMFLDNEFLSIYFVDITPSQDAVSKESLARLLRYGAIRFRKGFHSSNINMGRSAILNAIDMLSQADAHSGRFEIPGAWVFYAERRLYVRLMAAIRNIFAVDTEFDAVDTYFQRLNSVWAMHGMIYYAEDVIEDGEHIGANLLIDALKLELEAEPYWMVIEKMMEKYLEEIVA